MERVAVDDMSEYSRYGSTTFTSRFTSTAHSTCAPTTLQRNFGFAWGLGGWLLPNFLARAGAEVVGRMQARVSPGRSTATFASHYQPAHRALHEALQPRGHGRLRATGNGAEVPYRRPRR
jgi:NADPH2:quinone reductase